MSTLLALGGARSGKSRFAQAHIEAVPGTLAFIATAEPRDDEMADRIARHQADRGPRWIACKAPYDLTGAISRMQASADAILVDCLTLWLSNLMLADCDIPLAAAGLIDAIRQCPVPIALVANEVGMGIVPDNALARRFRDEAGRLNQQVAATVEKVVLLVAGLPLVIKPAH